MSRASLRSPFLVFVLLCLNFVSKFAVRDLCLCSFKRELLSRFGGRCPGASPCSEGRCSQRRPSTAALEPAGCRGVWARGGQAGCPSGLTGAVRRRLPMAVSVWASPNLSPRFL